MLLEDKNRQLGDVITKCQKEKDLLTISYSRVVKENENFILQSQAHKIQKNDSTKEIELLKKNAENMNDMKSNLFVYDIYF
jgi:predicted transcriptional regulator